MPFTIINSSQYTAKDLALLVMKMDAEVFDNFNYKVLDKRLFNNPTNIDTSKYDLHLHIDEPTLNSNNLLTTVTTCSLTTWTYTCEVCGLMNCTVNPGYSYSTSFCTYSMYNTGVELPIGGGGGGAGGGGSSTTTPPPIITPSPTTTVGWTPIDVDDPNYFDVISDPTLPPYTIGNSEPIIPSLQGLFNCFDLIPDAGATYSVKLCVDIPINSFWNAPFNASQSPGHTFLTFTKTNGSQTKSLSVGFYPVSGGNPINPIVPGGFKNDGFTTHEYNAALAVNGITPTAFNNVKNYLIAHEHDTYNLYTKNCSTIALNAFNSIGSQQITCDLFTVNVNPTSIIPLNLYFLHSPQKIYKKLRSLTPAATNITKEFNVDTQAPFNSSYACP